MLSFAFCAGCGVPIGVSKDPKPLRSKVHCTLLCEAQPSAGAQEFRDDLIVTLALGSTPRTARELAELFDMSASAVYNVIARYKEVDDSSFLRYGSPCSV